VSITQVMLLKELCQKDVYKPAEKNGVKVVVV